LTPDGLEFLSRFEFPGNVRELKNLMEREYYCDTLEISAADLKRIFRTMTPIRRRP